MRCRSLSSPRRRVAARGGARPGGAACTCRPASRSSSSPPACSSLAPARRTGGDVFVAESAPVDCACCGRWMGASSRKPPCSPVTIWPSVRHRLLAAGTGTALRLYGGDGSGRALSLSGRRPATARSRAGDRPLSRPAVATATMSRATWCSRRTAPGSAPRIRLGRFRGHGLGTDGEEERADVLVFDADGDNRVFATGLRNCTAEAIAPRPAHCGAW